MTTNTQLSPAHQHIDDGHTPKDFWINALGEYGHTWSEGGETISGTLNLRDVAEDAGIPWEPPYDLPAEVMKRAWDDALWEEVVDPRERTLYRLWEHLQPISGSDYRFNGGIKYKRRPKPWLHMCIEYILTDEMHTKLLALAEAHGARVSEMWVDRDGGTQYEVTFPALGRSLPELAKVQLDWTAAVEKAGLLERQVNVL